MSLMVIGMPWSGPRSSPRRTAASAARASARACSWAGVTTALTIGLIASIWATAASTASTGETSPARIRAARSVAVRKAISDALIVVGCGLGLARRDRQPRHHEPDRVQRRHEVGLLHDVKLDQRGADGGPGRIVAVVGDGGLEGRDHREALVDVPHGVQPGLLGVGVVLLPGRREAGDRTGVDVRGRRDAAGAARAQR